MSPILSDQFGWWLMRTMAYGINVALLALILAEIPMALSSAAVTERWGVVRRALLFCLVACLAIAVAVTCAEFGKSYQVWPGRYSFPSGHTSFAASAAAAIATYRGKVWWLLGAPLVALMMIALVCLRVHNVIDVLGGFVLGTSLGIGITRLLLRTRVAEPVDVAVEE